ncbi:autotransporter domain-containing protein [Bordetella sp. 15P40C-2]|uniref:autotransporter domain-containing protein n=1 Tax=Bordetella sp. 15P40C-2 TaxID=2572246 RepID=UPI0013251BC2|nr:autotransporter serine protease [Bordetella sp. 15P40C-2]MVW71318.1 autotransporter domain-containing protein [Bordetella sp. 15P40C-2]
MPTRPPLGLTRIYAALCLAIGSGPAIAQVPWNLQMVNADVAHALGYTGKDIIVGVIDSGLDMHHPAFRGRVDPRSMNFIDPGQPVTDPGRHGTHVSGIIGAGLNTGPMYGVAYDSTLLAMQAIGGREDDDDEDDDDDTVSVKALRYAAQLKLKVVNGSYGPPAIPPRWDRETGQLNPTYQLMPYQILLFNDDTGAADDLPQYEAVAAAAEADVLMVFAAGNEYQEQPLASANPTGLAILPYIRPENRNSGVYQYIRGGEDNIPDIKDPSTFVYLDNNDPRVAHLDYSHLQDKLIAAVAVGPDGKIAAYSNRCGVAWQWCMAAPGGNGEDEVDEGILSTVPGGYDVMSGTSMAAPLIAGSAAVLRGAFPYLTASQTIEVLLTTTDRAGDYADRATYGRGLLDLGRAILGPGQFGAEGFAPLFDVNTQGFNSTWSGDISGSGGLTKRGAGLLTLAGNNSYSGDTTIAGGALRVSGSIASSSVLVEPDALLTGNGTVGSTRVAGTIAPAAADGSIATMTVNGNYQQLTGSTLLASITDQGDSTQLRVSGTAEVQGGTLQVQGISPHTVDKQFAVIQTQGGVAGAFDQVPNDYIFIGLNTVVLGNTLALSVDRQEGGFGSVGTSRNQRAVGGGMDGLNAGNAVFDNLIMSTDAAAARRAMDRLSGDLHPSLLGVLTTQSAITRDALTDRSRLAQAGAGVDVWGRYTGSRAHLSSDGNAGGLRNHYNGAIFGVDTDVTPHTRLGVAFGFGHSSADVSSRNANAKIDSYTLGAYGSSGMGVANLRYGAAYSWHQIDSRRSALEGSPRVKADYDARSAQAFIELATTATLGAATLEPFASLAYVHTRADSFDESGAAGLRGKRSSFDLGFTTLGLRAGTQWTLANRSTLGLDASLGWIHALGGTTPKTSMSFQPGASFTTAGLPVARDALAVQTGLTWHHSEHASLNVSYQGQFGQRTSDQGLSLNARWRF